MATAEPIEVEVWSDIACPWCWVGKRNLEQALEDFDGEVRVTWRAFELDPAAPTVSPDEVDYVAKLAAKYRMTREQAQGFIDRMVEAGAERGIEFRFDRVRPSNTFNAHRLLSWARSFGLQDALKERLFQAYMTEGLAVNDVSTLLRLATEVGLDPDAADMMLASDDHRDEVLEDKSRARTLGVSGVPFFLINSSIGLSGAQPPELLTQAMTHAQQVQADSAAPVCTPDGCSE